MVEINLQMTRREIGDLLRKQREQHKYSLSKVAAGVGISMGTICKIENAQVKTSLENLQTLFAYYGITSLKVELKSIQLNITYTTHENSLKRNAPEGAVAPGA